MSHTIDCSQETQRRPPAGQGDHLVCPAPPAAPRKDVLDAGFTTPWWSYGSRWAAVRFVGRPTRGAQGCHLDPGCCRGVCRCHYDFPGDRTRAVAGFAGYTFHVPIDGPFLLRSLRHPSASGSSWAGNAAAVDVDQGVPGPARRLGGPFPAGPGADRQHRHTRRRGTSIRLSAISPHLLAAAADPGPRGQRPRHVFTPAGEGGQTRAHHTNSREGHRHSRSPSTPWTFWTATSPGRVLHYQ